MVSARTGLNTLILPILLASALMVPHASAQIERTSLDTTPGATQLKLPPEQMGDLLMARKMFRDAIESYREGPQKSPVIWDKIGIAYHQLGDPDAINNVGTVLYSEKKYRSAISRYHKALSIAPETASIWSNLGTAWYARGNYVEMSKCYAKALEIDPAVFEAHNSVGTTMQDRAVADKARYHYEMARIYAQAGKNDMALQYLRKSLEEGFKDKDKLSKAPEFAGLRDTTEFKDLLTLEPRVL
jgi:tetratricopeptide (TPR) repeat protein